MSAFGRRSGMGNGSGGGRPAFGTARPMKGPALVNPAPSDGGSQFPPIDALGVPDEEPVAGVFDRSDAMARLADRQAQSGEQASSRNEGFEASIHRDRKSTR